MARPYVLSLEAASGAPEGEPLYASIARAVAADIARGRLKPDEKLPGSRALAATLGVHRNTVLAALRELTAQGWVEARPARGVFVRALAAAEQPRPSARAARLRSEVPRRPGFDFDASPLHPHAVGRGAPPKQLVLTGGVPDPRLFPAELLARAYRRALRRRGGELLDYGDAYGDRRLRAALADMLTRLRGIAASPDDVLITRGSQQAIWLAAHCLLGPGDRVGVECWGYPPAWSALRGTGATLVPLEVDGEGVSLASIERALEGGPLRALYLTPHHQYPTMVALSAQRRIGLLRLLAQHRIALLEDDYTHEFHFEGRPRLPLASADRDGHVVYIGTLSKILAPGLRIGYAVAPPAVLARMAALRTSVDRQGDAIAEAAVAELLEDGEIERHARRMRRIYHARRDVLAEALTRHLGDRVSFALPQGGMAFWVQVQDGAAIPRWVERARARGVIFRAGSELHVAPRGDEPFVRMGFTRLDEAELERAVRIVAATA
ncbi:MAG: PLP-dependent aminotransferase family protein [Polyangiales bacterium]